MPVLPLLAVLAVVLPLGYLTQNLVLGSGRVVSIARRNLTRGLQSNAPEAGSLESRRTGLSSLLRVLTPDSSARRMRRLVDLAGAGPTLTLTRLLWAKLLLAAVTGLIGLAVLASGGGLLTWLLVPAVVAGVYHLPEVVVHGRGQERQKAIARELPDTLDQMTVAVAAGLGFEAAMARTAASGRGPLAQELGRTLQDVAVGRPRREAYDALLRRTDVPELKRFVGAINQADSYGIGITDVLRVQADEMRIKRRQRAKEEAMKIPVKVTFPLMLCLLPALLLIVVSPAVMGLAGSLG